MHARQGNRYIAPLSNEHGSYTCACQSDCYVQINSSRISDALSTDLMSYASIHSQNMSNNTTLTGSTRNSRTSSASNDNVADKKFISKCSFFILIGLTALSLSFGILSTVMFFQLSSKYDELEIKVSFTEASVANVQREPPICLPCDEIAQGPFEQDNLELKQLIHSHENGTEICCAKSTKEMSILLNIFARRKQMQKCAEDLLKDNRTAASCVNRSVGTPVLTFNGTEKISAFLRAGIQNSSAKGYTSTDEPIKNWLTSEPGTHRFGIDLVGDQLVVPKSGHYFVYSQAGFLIRYENGSQNINVEPQSLFHKVNRYNMIYPLGKQELLRSTVTQCWVKNKEYGRYTSYVGAALLLNKGDHIYVTVSLVYHLSRDSSNTYFGLFFMF